MGDTVLFFGCRRSNEDFIYEDEMNDFLRDGTLTAFPLAFSREVRARCRLWSAARCSPSRSCLADARLQSVRAEQAGGAQGPCVAADPRRARSLLRLRVRAERAVSQLCRVGC